MISKQSMYSSGGNNDNSNKKKRKPPATTNSSKSEKRKSKGGSNSSVGGNKSVGTGNSTQSYDEFIQQIQHDIKKANKDPEKEFQVLNGHII